MTAPAVTGDRIVAHRLRFATPPAARVRWPASFGRRFLVTVDVEEEFDWTRPFSGHARSVRAIAALPAWHRAMAGEGIAPVYLVDHPVAADPAAAALLRPLLTDGSTVGAQLHPWVNPPHVEVPSELASFAGNLPPALEAAKLDQLVDAVERAFGRRPLIYRAGRYGIGPATLALLASRGFRIDASMRARFDYRAAGGCDFGAVGPDAFHLPGGIVELPLSTIHTGALRRHGVALHRAAGRVPWGRGLLSRGGLLSRVPLTPEGTTAAAARAAVAVAAARRHDLLQLTFHSPSLVPGNTPYVRDARDLALFHDWWGQVIAALRTAGYAPVTLDEVLAAVGPAGLEPAT
ncbi:WalW protein [Sphingomonas adhaesiva]|uniref:WalW protein n=1 Tax=Sphingomonas adhaesiva TaxID=28212 RepID=UPI002FF9F9C1